MICKDFSCGKVKIEEKCRTDSGFDSCKIDDCKYKDCYYCVHSGKKDSISWCWLHSKSVKMKLPY